MGVRANLVRKNVKYLNKDFGEYRKALIEFTRNYFPNTYNDFNESDPGMMFIELASYVGGVLSFYTDVQLRESLLSTVEEKINMYNLASSLGYRPKITTPASVDLDVFQLLPAIGSGGNTSPDWRYALQVSANMTVSSDVGKTFRTVDSIDFRYSSSYSPTEVSVYSLDDAGEVEYFMLKKNVRAVSGNIRTRTYTFNEAKPYDKIVLPDTDVLEIIDIVDSEQDTWYEVPYLAQDLVAKEVPNLPFNDSVLSQYRSSVPYLLCYEKKEKRFVTRLRADDKVEIQFGAGISSEADEDIEPNPMNVGIGLDYFERAVDLSIDPKNFLYTRTYGKTPSNTTLTVRYTYGGGLSDNVPANSITTVQQKLITSPSDGINASIHNTIQSTLAVNNPQPACGGTSQKSIENVRREAIANFAAQNRAVTREDYIVRSYSMPVKYGAIAKAYVEQDMQISNDRFTEFYPNPLALNLYILGYNSQKNFVPANDAIKFNLINYMKQYRVMTDSINIKDAFIINIGVDFEIVPDLAYNSNEVLLRCINSMIDYFNNDNMEINKPIFISDIICILKDIEGVRTVADIKILNLHDTTQGYSANYYDINNATRNEIIYPSLDPSVFEVKYPQRDIVGRVVNA